MTCTDIIWEMFIYVKLAVRLNFRERNVLSAPEWEASEFSAFLYGYASKEEAEKVLRDFEAHRGEVFMDPEMKHILGTVEFSVGYAFYPEDGTDYHVLMHISDERMYEEKKKRKGRRSRE